MGSILEILRSHCLCECFLDGGEFTLKYMHQNLAEAHVYDILCKYHDLIYCVHAAWTGSFESVASGGTSQNLYTNKQWIVSMQIYSQKSTVTYTF